MASGDHRKRPSPAGRKKKPARRWPKRRKSLLGVWVSIAVLLLIAAYLGSLELSRPHVRGDRLRYDLFVKYTETGKIQSALILQQDQMATGTYIRPDRTVAAYNAPILPSVEASAVNLLVSNAVPTTVDQQVKKRLATLATYTLPLLILILLFAYLIISSRRGTGLFSIRSGARKVRPEDTNVSFADVAGQDAAVASLRELKEFLSDPERFAEMGAVVPKGVLLFGPPGCGKTMLAKALASEAGASFYSISGSDFVEMYVGVGASRVRDLFREAREHAPALIFIDELDSVGRVRGTHNNVSSHTEQEQALNQILAEMDGVSPSEGVIVLAATNRPDVLDPALLRPGRFDRTIGLERPNEEDRLAILQIHARGKSLAPRVDLPAIARKAIGMTGADLASVMNESALIAAREGKAQIDQVDLADALQRILEAPERQRRLAMRSRSVGKRFTAEERVMFADVAGQDTAVADLQEIKEFLIDPERFTDLGAAIPKGVLLYGPPGCGKTMLAKALASEANAAFFSVAASEFVQVFVGEGASRVRDLFAEARSMAPAIIFIDEIDAVGRSRGGRSAVVSSGEQEQTLNQILTEMDGFSVSSGIMVLAATNRADILDPALLRPGRFDRTVGLELPDEKGRLAILQKHARGKVLASDVDLAAIANKAFGLTGADLASVVNEAALAAGRLDHDAISQVQLSDSLKRVMAAPDRQRRLSMRSRSVGKRFSADDRITFSDVAGVDDAIEELAEVREYLTEPERFAELGARAPRGILLSGPPGCGKTLLARAVAGESNAAFISVGGTDFVEVFVGEGASRVRDIFAEARAMAPAIVFIDEIDAMGAHRTSFSTSGQRETENTLNQLLIELDGFEARAAVIVMAATNRPDMLDSALLRPGRFDRQVTIALPDRAGRRAILELYTRNKPLGADVDLDKVAGLTSGMSGADLENVVNEAALLTSRARAARITMALMEEGIDRAYMGVSSRSTRMSEEERRIVAYHEGGHGLVAASLKGAMPPHKLTIVPRGGALGRCTMLDDKDRTLVSRSMLVDRMATMVAGVVAEQIVFGEASSGSASDLHHVGDLARAMVRDFGMSKGMGLLGYPEPIDGFGRPQRTYSEESARAIDAEVRILVDEATRSAGSVLTTRRDALDRIAATLLRQETVTSAELYRLAGMVVPARREPETRVPQGPRERGGTP